MNENKYEQRFVIKCCVYNGETPTVTCENKFLVTYYCQDLKFLDVKVFLDGRESVQDDLRSGRTLSSKYDENVGKI